MESGGALGDVQYDKIAWWDHRYAVFGSSEFDWLQSWTDIAWAVQPLLMQKGSRVLVVGSGNSPFGSEIHATGLAEVVSVDLSEVAVKQMRERYPDLQFEVMDVRDMSPFPDASFDLVLDKGMLDTLVCYDEKSDSVDRYKREVYRLLRPNGAWMVISLHSPKYNLNVLKEGPTKDLGSVEYRWREPVVCKRIVNPRYDPDEDPASTYAHTLLVLRRLPYDNSEDFVEKAAAACDPYWSYVCELQSDALEMRKVLVDLEPGSQDAQLLSESMHIFSLLTDDEAEFGSEDDEEERAPREEGEGEGKISGKEAAAEYGSRDYWNRRYDIVPEAFDWLVEWQDFIQAVGGLAPSLSKDARILVLGCGNANFSLDMYDAGYTQVTNADTSKTAIDLMSERAGSERAEMLWLVQDVTEMRGVFPDASFDVTIDKSTMDCLFCCNGADSKLIDMVFEANRVLRPGGQHICVSLHTPKEALPVLESVAQWEIVYFPVPNPKYEEGKDQSREYYLFICTKSAH